MELRIKGIRNGRLYYLDSDGLEVSKTVSNVINPKYVREGIAEVSIEGDTVTFIKMIKKDFQQTIPEKMDNPETKYRRPIEIIRQECLSEALKISLNMGGDIVKETLEIADKFVGWVSK